MVEKSNIYLKNLKVIEKRYPNIAREIKKRKSSNLYLIKKTGPDKQVNLFLNSLSNYYYEQIDPLGSTTKYLSTLDTINAQITVLLGFGLGYEMSSFITNFSKESRTKAILVVEKDIEVFKAAITYVDFTRFLADENIEFLVGIEEDQLFTHMVEFFKKNYKFRYAKAIKPIYHPSSLLLNKSYYLNALKKMREAAVYQINFYGNSPEDSLIGIDNMLENLQEIIENPGIKLLKNKFKGKPAVVVSTGPSLNKNKHLLKEIQDKALIICPDASLRILLDIGVKPHLVTSLERVEATVELMKGYTKEEVEDVYFAATPVIKNESYQHYPGPRIIVYRNFDHFKWLQLDKGILDIKHSSGNMAFKLAEYIGCSTIVLVGQDLAYSDDGKTHASGAILGEVQGQINQMGQLYVKGNFTDQILTTQVWNLFRQAYETDIYGYNGNVINATEGGAYISGANIMPLREAIDNYMTEYINPSNQIRKYLKHDIPNINTNNHISDLIGNTISDIDAIYALCSKGISLIDQNNQVLNSYLSGETIKSISINDVYKQIVAPRNMISIKYKDTNQLLIMHVIQSYYIHFEINLNELYAKYPTENQAIAKMCILHRKWYHVLRGILEKLANSLLVAKQQSIKNPNWNEDEKKWISYLELNN